MQFYGMSLREVEGLTAEEDEMLWQAITVIEARDALLRLKIASFPHMKRAHQEKIHRELHKAAYPWNYEAKREITFEQLAAILNGRGKV